MLEKKTVFQNVAFAMEITGASRKEIKEKVDITLSLMGLSAKRDEYPTHLSGGEQQRVALARSIVNGPDILIADEPTGNLDPKNSAEIMSLLKMINSYGTTVLVATHEQSMADEMGMRVIRLDHGKNISEEIVSKENTSELETERDIEAESMPENDIAEEPAKTEAEEPVQVEIPVASINITSLQPKNEVEEKIDEEEVKEESEENA